MQVGTRSKKFQAICGRDASPQARVKQRISAAFIMPQVQPSIGWLNCTEKVNLRHYGTYENPLLFLALSSSEWMTTSLPRSIDLHLQQMSDPGSEAYPRFAFAILPFPHIRGPQKVLQANRYPFPRSTFLIKWRSGSLPHFPFLFAPYAQYSQHLVDGSMLLFQSMVSIQSVYKKT